MYPIIPCHPWTVVAVEWIFFSFAAIFVFLRIYLRVSRKRFSAGDAVVIISLVSFLWAVACDTTLVAQGFSDANLFVPFDSPDSIFQRIEKNRLRRLLQIMWVSTIPYYSTLWLVKLALILLYYQLLTPEIKAPVLRKVLHASAFIVLASYIAVMAANMFWCIPVSGNWEVDDPSKICLEYWMMPPYILSLVLHVSTEILVFSIPFRLLRYLRLDKRTRRAVTGLFALGFFGVAVTISRIIYVEITPPSPIMSAVQSWAALEQATGMVVACLPAVWTLNMGLKEDPTRLYVSDAALDNNLLRPGRDKKNRSTISSEDEEAGKERWWWELRAQQRRSDHLKDGRAGNTLNSQSSGSGRSIIHL